jgi:hypothetical protein
VFTGYCYCTQVRRGEEGRGGEGEAEGIVETGGRGEKGMEEGGGGEREEQTVESGLTCHTRPLFLSVADNPLLDLENLSGLGSLFTTVRTQRARCTFVYATSATKKKKKQITLGREATHLSY